MNTTDNTLNKTGMINCTGQTKYHLKVQSSSLHVRKTSKSVKKNTLRHVYVYTYSFVGQSVFEEISDV